MSVLDLADLRVAIHDKPALAGYTALRHSLLPTGYSSFISCVDADGVELGAIGNMDGYWHAFVVHPEVGYDCGCYATAPLAFEAVVNHHREDDLEDL